MLQNWWIFVIIYLIATLIYDQMYKVATKSCKKDASLVVLMEFLGGCFALLLLPFLNIQFPSDIKIWGIWAIAIIFYAITDRINATVRRGVEASTFSILKQLSTAFMIFGGILFLKEEIVISKMLGSILIILSNVMVFYQKGKFHWNRYVLLGILGNITLSIALFLDVNISACFTLPFYVAMTLLIPSILIFFTHKMKIEEIKSEWNTGNKMAILLTSCTWAIMIMSMLRAYQLGEVTTIAPLFSMAVILNIGAGYFFLKEREHVVRKIIAAIAIVISVVLINLS